MKIVQITTCVLSADRGGGGDLGAIVNFILRLLSGLGYKIVEKGTEVYGRQGCIFCPPTPPLGSVADPFHFGTDPRIRLSE